MKPPPDGPHTVDHAAQPAEDSGRTMYDGRPHNEPTLPSSRVATMPMPGAQPTRFGKFNLLRLIAAGGMGEVYEAEELAADPCDHNRLVPVRRVALKRILPRYLQSPGAVERFSRETQAGKALDHPNIVPVYESGDVGGEHFFTMPYVAGGDLARHVNDDPLTPRQAARVVMQMAQAVAYAHQAAQKPVIHRDIKPQNIVLQPTPTTADDVLLDDSRISFIPRLTDFGLARLVAEDSSLSMAQKGEAMGTPGYMPPEQAIGDVENIGPASDIYSLGAVLYALLAGRPPFPVKQPTSEGQPIQVLAILNQVMTLEPPRIRAVRPGVPQELEDICGKCLRKAPEDRYQNATQLAEALDDFLSGREPRHTPRADGWLSLAGRRLSQALLKNPLWAAYLAVTTVGLLALVVFLCLRHEAGHEGLLRRAEAHVAAARTKADPGAAAERLQLACEAYDRLIGEAPPAPHTLPWWVARAEAHLLRARHLSSLPSGHEEARQECHLARQQMLRLGEACPDDDRQLACLADAFQALAEVVVTDEGPSAHEQAIGHYREALAIRKKLCDNAPGDPARLLALARCHGYLGDSYLQFGKKALAWDAYTQARAQRAKAVRLLSDQPGPALDEAHCLHARDFANFALFHEWDDSPKAIDRAREQRQQRVRYYTEHLAHVRPLPGEFRLERPDAYVALADDQLDCLGDRPTHQELGPTFANLDRAMSEYNELLKAGPGAYQVRLRVAAAQTVYAEALVMEGKKDEAKKLLGEALRFYRGREAPKDRHSTLYAMALIHAWLGVIDSKDVESPRLAMVCLERAAELGFHNHARLTRERAFKGLRASPEYAARFAKLEKKLRAN